jgi:ABC-type phosphate/phosphonate transport system substrate-binding protein
MKVQILGGKTIKGLHLTIKVGIVLALILAGGAACSSNVETPTVEGPTPTQPPPPTAIPAQPTVPPLGSVDNPLIAMFVSSKSEAGMESLATAFSDSAGLEVEVQLTESYGEAYRALCDGRAQIVSLNAFGYLAASQAECGEALWVVEKDEKIAEQSQFVALTISGVWVIWDFEGRPFCRTDALSATGWVVPSLAMKARQFEPQTELAAIIDVGSDEEVIRKVHDAECHVGVVTVGSVEEVLPTLARPSSIRILVDEELPPVPHDVVVLSTIVDESMRALLLDAVLPREDDLAALIDADALVDLDDGEDNPFTPLQELFEKADINPASLAK